MVNLKGAVVLAVAAVVCALVLGGVYQIHVDSGILWRVNRFSGRTVLCMPVRIEDRNVNEPGCRDVTITIETETAARARIDAEVWKLLVTDPAELREFFLAEPEHLLKALWPSMSDDELKSLERRLKEPARAPSPNKPQAPAK